MLTLLLGACTAIPFGGEGGRLEPATWRVIDSRPDSSTITIQIITGPEELAQRVEVREEYDTVTITVLQPVFEGGPHTSEGILETREIELSRPLGSRRIVEGAL